MLVIRQERLARGWTLDYVARHIDITKAAYRNIEVGQRKPSYDVLVKILDLFNYDDPRILFGEEIPDKTKQPGGNPAKNVTKAE